MGTTNRCEGEVSFLNGQRMIWTRPFFVFTLLMMIKIDLTWVTIFGASKLMSALAVSLPSVWVVFCLIELFSRKHKLAVYMLVNALLTTIFFAAIMYYKYFGVIVNYHALQQVNQVTQVKGSVISLMHPYYLLIYSDLVVFGLLIWSRKLRDWGRPRLFVSRWHIALLLYLSLSLCMTTMWTNRGIVNEIKQAERMGILNYEVYTMLSSMKKETIDPATVTPQAIRELKKLPETESLQLRGAAEGRNTIVIQLESFQAWLIGLTIDGKAVTPNMNELVREGLYFPHIYQQVGQGNTSDAEFVTNTSFYVPPNGAASQVYSDKILPSLPRLFKEKGYETFTFHTNDVAFWNREELYAALGFDRYYDRRFFGDADTVFFGASDEVLYEKTAAELARIDRLGQKFYANVISATSHHPFSIPEYKEQIALPSKFDDTLVGDYIRAENYTDYALGKFVAKLKEYGLWEKSLIVIYGDHMGLPIYSLTEAEKRLLQEMLGRDYGYRDMLNIPLIMIAPGAVNPQTFDDRIGGQTDILPTIANLVGLNLEGRVYFGQDLVNYADNLLPERYYLPTGSFINREAIFVPGESFEDGVTYPLGIIAMSGGQELYKDEFDRALTLLKMSDSYVRHLPDREPPE